MRTRRTLVLLLAVGMVLAFGGAARAAFVAYHDLGGVTADAPGAYVTDQGADATQTIRLHNFADNADTGVDFTITGANGSQENTSSAHRYPNAGTDAAAIFGTSASPIVTHGGSTYEGGNGGSGSTTFTFAGLQPGLMYDVAIYGDRAASNDGVEEFTIHGTDWRANTSSASVQWDSFTTRMNTRPNNANGYVARWTNIDPGSDGAFSVEIDPEVTSVSNIAYLTAMRLQTVPAVAPPAPTGLTSPARALADMSRYGPGAWTGASMNYQGDVTWSIRPDGFPGGDVDLGEVPDQLVGGRIASWYVSGSETQPPVSLYYDLGQPMQVNELYLWWQNRSDRTSFGIPTDMDIDYIALSDAQPLVWDLATMQAVTDWTNAVLGYEPSLTETPSGSEQTLDVPDFAARYIRLTVNEAYSTSGGWGGLRQIALDVQPIPEGDGDIPEPATMALLGLAVAGLGGYVRKRKRT